MVNLRYMLGLIIENRDDLSDPEINSQSKI